MPKISSYPDNGVKNADQYVVAIGGVNKKRLGILPHLYKIVPSVASNNLTVALQDLDGNVFSATNPLQTKLYDELVVIESALSVTKNAATNWANLGSSELATKEVDLFTYLIKETGASAGIKLGWSRIPYGTVVGDFSSTTTNEKYLAGPTNYNATDKVQNIGRFNAILSAGAGYTWSLPATSVIINTQIFETRLLNMVSTVGGYTTAPTGAYYYKIMYDQVRYILSESAFSTSGLATEKTYTMPFTCANKSPALAYATTAPFLHDNGAYVAAGGVKIENNTNLATVYKSALAAWIASANNCNVNTFVIDFFLR